MAKCKCCGPFTADHAQKYRSVLAQGMIYQVLDTEIEALAQSQKSNQGAWDEQSRTAAMHVHHTGTAILVVQPEARHYDVLQHCPNWQVHGSHGTVIGVMMPCPDCGTNEFVRFCKLNVTGADRVRTIHDMHCSLMLVGNTYSCWNPAGSENCLKTKGKRNFAAFSQIALNQLPDLLRREYRFHVWPAPHKHGVTHILAQHILCNTTCITESVTQLQRAYNEKFREWNDRYYAFVGKERCKCQVKQQHMFNADVQSHITSEWSQPWPPAQNFNSSDLLSPPKADLFKSYLMLLFQKVQPHIDRHLHSRTPGEHISADGTFRLAKFTRGSDSKVIIFILGEDRSVCRWFVTESESFSHIELGIRRFALTLHDLGKLNDVMHWWDDRCCNRRSDVASHPLVRIFPNITRCPLKDAFHSIQLINESRNMLAKSEYLKQFAQEIGVCIRKPYEPDVNKVIAYLQKTEKCLSTVELRKRALQRSGYIRTVSESPDKMIQNLEQAAKRWRELDKRNLEHLHTQYQPVMKSHNSRLGHVGTEHQIQCVIDCIKKGCLSEGMDAEVNEYTRVNEMWTTDGPVGSKSGLQRYRYKGGTSKNESLHGKLNRILTHEGGGLRSPELMHIFITLEIMKHNDSIDRRNMKDGSHDNQLCDCDWTPALFAAQPDVAIQSADRCLSCTSSDKFPAVRNEPQGYNYMTERKNKVLHAQHLQTVRAECAEKIKYALDTDALAALELLSGSQQEVPPQPKKAKVRHVSARMKSPHWTQRSAGVRQETTLSRPEEMLLFNQCYESVKQQHEAQVGDSLYTTLCERYNAALMTAVSSGSEGRYAGLLTVQVARELLQSVERSCVRTQLQSTSATPSDSASPATVLIDSSISNAPRKRSRTTQKLQRPKFLASQTLKKTPSDMQSQQITATALRRGSRSRVPSMKAAENERQIVQDADNECCNISHNVSSAERLETLIRNHVRFSCRSECITDDKHECSAACFSFEDGTRYSSSVQGRAILQQMRKIGWTARESDGYARRTLDNLQAAFKTQGRTCFDYA